MFRTIHNVFNTWLDYDIIKGTLLTQGSCWKIKLYSITMKTWQQLRDAVYFSLKRVHADGWIEISSCKADAVILVNVVCKNRLKEPGCLAIIFESKFYNYEIICTFWSKSDKESFARPHPSRPCNQCFLHVSINFPAKSSENWTSYRLHSVQEGK